MMSERTMHWYALTFFGKHIVSGEQCWGCTYMGYPEKRMTKTKIDAAKAGAECNLSATLVNLAYLGQMTRAEFIG